MFAIIIFYLINQVIGTPEHHTFCVVGAGTAGIQLTAHLLHDNQDVLLIESDDTVGSSWKKLPINGKLRSVTHAHHQEDADATERGEKWKSPAQERNDHVSILSPETLRIHPFQSRKKNGKLRQRVDAKEYHNYLSKYVSNHSSIFNQDRNIPQFSTTNFAKYSHHQTAIDSLIARHSFTFTFNNTIY